MDISDEERMRRIADLNARLDEARSGDETDNQSFVETWKDATGMTEAELDTLRRMPPAVRDRKLLQKIRQLSGDEEPLPPRAARRRTLGSRIRHARPRPGRR